MLDWSQQAISIAQHVALKLWKEPAGGPSEDGKKKKKFKSGSIFMFKNNFKEVYFFKKII